MRKFFISGIGTGIGKTIASAIITESLKADYWKPIQAGNLDDSDTQSVKSLVSNSTTVFHPERFRLTAPMSPHAAAEIDNIEIKLEDFIFIMVVTLGMFSLGYYIGKKDEKKKLAAETRNVQFLPKRASERTTTL